MGEPCDWVFVVDWYGYGARQQRKSAFRSHSDVHRPVNPVSPGGFAVEQHRDPLTKYNGGCPPLVIAPRLKPIAIPAQMKRQNCLQMHTAPLSLRIDSLHVLLMARYAGGKYVVQSKRRSSKSREGRTTRPNRSPKNEKSKPGL